MNKQSLVSVIEKYYLNGIVEKVKWVVKDNNIKIDFISPNKDMLGTINSSFEMDDNTISIFDTSQLLKLISITDNFLTLDVCSEGMTATKLLIADKEYNLEYSLADTMLIPKLPKVEEPDYDYSFEVNSELIDKFIKAKKALGCSTFTIKSCFDENQNKVVSFVIGDNSSHSNKIMFDFPVIEMAVPSSILLFNADYVKEIFDSNKDVVTGKCSVSEQGLMKIEFTGKEDQKALYIVVAKS